MGLPEVRNDNVASFLSSIDIVGETVAQIMKDFGMFGVTITFSGNTDVAYHELHSQLTEQVGVLLERDYGRLLSILYQVDITDKDIVRTAAELPHYNHVEIVAHQIIVRDLKKVLTRHYFKSQQ
ncbi:MAG TPA: hypothetical protein VIH57_04770 [Bacteroidales bacterium]